MYHDSRLIMMTIYRETKTQIDKPTATNKISKNTPTILV